MTDDLILKISKLSKSFGPVQALREVDFELRKGEIHALAGENGAGKSTLMNIIDGILQPDSGEIRLDGKPVRISSPALAWVPVTMAEAAMLAAIRVWVSFMGLSFRVQVFFGFVRRTTRCIW